MGGVTSNLNPFSGKPQQAATGTGQVVNTQASLEQLPDSARPPEKLGGSKRKKGQSKKNNKNKRKSKKQR